MTTLEHIWCGGSLSCRIEGFFSPEECAEAAEAIKIVKPQEAKVMVEDGSSQYQEEVRKGTAYHWQSSVHENAKKAFQKISKASLMLNEERWRFNMEDNEDGSINITDYPLGGHFDWHMDWSCHHRVNSNRFLSAVVQVTPWNQYEGGDLQIQAGWGIADAPRGQGDLIVFPSFMYHRVTPVTKGTRISLIAWIFGKMS